MPDLFEVVDISGRPAVYLEEGGSKPGKIWIEIEGDDRLWLWKQVRGPTSGGRPPGEDWAEKVASHIAEELGVPAARVELAQRNGERGVLSRMVRDREAHSFDLGNVVLQRHDPKYDLDQTGPAMGHTLAAIWNALADYSGPPALPPPRWVGSADAPSSGAQFAFAGYVMFDALIANTDRHHENWAVVSGTGLRALAPSFDHASSLAFGLSEDEKQRRLTTRDPNYTVAAWAERGRAKFEGSPTLVEAAAEAMHLLDDLCSAEWEFRLASIEVDQVRSIVDRVPADLMSQADRRFSVEVIATNQRRLLDACW